MKLKDVYITWNNDLIVEVVPKSDGVPKGDKCYDHEGYFDPSDWEGLKSAEFFLELYTSLTTNGCAPLDVYREFKKIDEYEELEGKIWKAIDARHAA